MKKLLQYAGLAFLIAVPASADAILPNGTFHEFVAYNLGGAVEACAGRCLPSTNPSGINYSVATPWTFNGPANLLVIDLFLSGDRYEVFDNNISLGLTSAPGIELQCGQVLVADIGCSIADVNFSRGFYVLGAGSHSITINYITTTFVGHSGAALQLTSAVPEPATGALLLSAGLLGFAAARKRKTAWQKLP